MVHQPSVELGSCIGGIPVKIHYTYFLLLIIMMLSSIKYNDSMYLIFIFLIYGPIMLITITIHEFGHALTTQKLGGEVDSIMLWPLGGFALCGPPTGGPMGDLKVAIAGPITHIPQILFWFIIMVISVGGDLSNVSFGVSFNSLNSGVGSFIATLSAQAIVLNITLMIFNLFIPAYPLDGGRVLASTLLLRGVQRIKAAFITSITAMVIAAVLVIIGLYLFFGNPNNSNGLFQIFIAVFIFGSSYQLFTLARTGNVDSHPLFGRECYDSNVELGSSGGGRCAGES